MTPRKERCRARVLRAILAGMVVTLSQFSEARSRCAPADADVPPAGLAKQAATRVQLEKTVHQVELADPVSPSTPARLFDLVLSKDRNGFPVEYALSFETPVCSDGQCRVVELTMVWNALGYFERLRCPPGKPLTKKEHVPFTAEDYAKLDRILKERSSILESWTLAYLERPEQASNGVDAVTSATPITVRDSVIQDAAYTTWALWNWANGQIVSKLRGITRQNCTPEYLNHLLISEDRRYADFALDYVTKQHPSDPQFVQGVVHLLENGERDQITSSLEFLGQVIQDKRKLHALLIESCSRMRSADCPLILQELAAEPDLPATTLEGLTGQMTQLQYFPVHLILRMLEEREFASKKTISDVAELLDSDNFFIARRAFEHLLKQDLDAETGSRVKVFGKRNRDRL